MKNCFLIYDDKKHASVKICVCRRTWPGLHLKRRKKHRYALGIGRMIMILVIMMEMMMMMEIMMIDDDEEKRRLCSLHGMEVPVCRETPSAKIFLAVIVRCYNHDDDFDDDDDHGDDYHGDDDHGDGHHDQGMKASGVCNYHWHCQHRHDLKRHYTVQLFSLKSSSYSTPEGKVYSKGFHIALH